MSKMKRALQITGLFVSYVVIGALCFLVGTYFGPRAQLASLELQAEETGERTGYLAVYQAGLPGRDIALAVCGATRSELDYFLQTYALSGPGQHYVFTCSEFEKDTL